MPSTETTYSRRWLYLLAVVAGLSVVSCGALILEPTPAPELQPVDLAQSIASTVAPEATPQPPSEEETTQGEHPDLNKFSPVIDPAPVTGLQMRSQALERRLMEAGGTVDLARVNNQRGRIVSINIILGSGAASKDSLEHSRIKIYVEGGLEPVADLELVDFFFTRGFSPSDGDPSRWLSDQVGVSSYYLRTGDPYPVGRIGFYRFVEIPFENSVLVELHNGDAENEVQVFSQVEYLVEPASEPAIPTMEFQTSVVEQMALNPGDTVELLNLSHRAGYIDSIYLSVWGEPVKSFHWPEMNMAVRVGDESALIYDSSGTEDFFLSSWAWSAGPYTQRLHGHPVHRLNGWNSQYRYFEPGLWFDDGITLTWEPGAHDAPELTAGGDDQPVEAWIVVTYYLVPE